MRTNAARAVLPLPDTKRSRPGCGPNLVSRSAQPDAQVAILSLLGDYWLESPEAIRDGSNSPSDRDDEQIPGDCDLSGVEIGQPLSTTCRSGRNLSPFAHIAEDQRISRIRRLRNSTGSLCPHNPKWPFVLSRPGCSLCDGGVIFERSPSEMIEPLSSTRIVVPFTVTS